jgi:hypothetical protein
VRNLRRGPQDELAGGTWLRDDAARLHGTAKDPLLAEGPRDHDFCFREELIDVAAVGEAEGEAAVGPELGMDERGTVLERRLHLDHARQRLQIRRDDLRAVLRGRRGLADHDGDPVSGEPGDVHGQRPVVGDLRLLVDTPDHGQRGRPIRSQILAGERRHDAGDGERGRNVHRSDRGVGERAPHHGHVKDVSERQVVDVSSAPCHELAAFPRRDWTTGPAFAHFTPPLRCRCGRRTRS